MGEVIPFKGRHPTELPPHAVDLLGKLDPERLQLFCVVISQKQPWWPDGHPEKLHLLGWQERDCGPVGYAIDGRTFYFSSYVRFEDAALDAKGYAAAYNVPWFDWRDLDDNGGRAA